MQDARDYAIAGGVCTSIMRDQQQQARRPYEEIADLIGCVNDLPADLSETTGDRFAEIVREKHDARGDPQIKQMKARG